MSNENEQLEALTEIRSMMERSSRFISLSGLAGVFAGLFAFAGIAAAYMHLGLGSSSLPYYEQAVNAGGEPNPEFLTFLVGDALLVLVASLCAGVFFSARKARKKGQPIWDGTAKRMLANIMIPLVTGGLFCLVLLSQGIVFLVAPATLIFYGLALINASKYTLNDIRYLGLCEIGLGLIASAFPGLGLLLWALGFGALHIIYGMIMYYKYER
jgi:hypothetical protein